MEPLELVAQVLNVGVDKIVDRLILIVSGFAAVGLLAMAIIEVLKAIFQPRLFFHHWMLRKEVRRGLIWFATTKEQILAIEEDILKIEALIADYASAGSPLILYRQSTEDCMAGVKSALGVALMEPEKSAHALMIKAWCENAEISRLNKLRTLKEQLQVTTSPEERKPINAAISSEVTYLNTLIDSNINGLQTKMNFRWKMVLQVFAVAMSMSIIALIVTSADEFTLRWFVFSFFGGLFAPFAHDLMKNLTAIKR